MVAAVIRERKFCVREVARCSEQAQPLSDEGCCLRVGDDLFDRAGPAPDLKLTQYGLFVKMHGAAGLYRAGHGAEREQACQAVEKPHSAAEGAPVSGRLRLNRRGLPVLLSCIVVLVLVAV